MCRRERKDIIAIAIETGIQNTGNKLSFFYKLYRWRAIQTFYFCFTLTFLWKCIIYFLLILSSLSSAECLMYLFYARSNSFSDVFPHSYTYPTKPTDYLGPSHLQYYYPLQGRPSVSIVLTFDGVQVWPSSCCGLRWSILPAIWPPWSPSPWPPSPPSPSSPASSTTSRSWFNRFVSFDRQRQLDADIRCNLMTR